MENKQTIFQNDIPFHKVKNLANKNNYKLYQIMFHDNKVVASDAHNLIEIHHIADDTRREALVDASLFKSGDTLDWDDENETYVISRKDGSLLPVTTEDPLNYVNYENAMPSKNVRNHKTIRLSKDGLKKIVEALPDDGNYLDITVFDEGRSKPVMLETPSTTAYTMPMGEQPADSHQSENEV